MTPDEFINVIAGWISTALNALVDGGVLASFIDWRRVEAALMVGRDPGLSPST